MANPPSIERPDLQDLLAYIEGRGDEAVRAQVLKRLDEDEEYLALMVDLVPMLREAGEIPLPEESTVGPPAGEELPLPQKVIGHPLRFRRSGALITTLAALLSITLGLWLFSRANRSLSPDALSREMAAKVATDWVEENPFVRGFRGGPGEPDSNDYLLAGMQILDLRVTFQKKQAEESLKRIADLQRSLDTVTFNATFGALDTKLKTSEVKSDRWWQEVNEAAEDGFHFLIADGLDPQEGRLLSEGMCWRAAWLAAEAKNSSFFEDELAKKQCLEVIGEESWKADSEVIQDAFDSRP